MQLYNGMTPALNSITKALNSTISSFEAMQRASGHAVDTGSIQTAREELAKAETSFDKVEQEIKEANKAQQNFNNDIRNGDGAAKSLHSTFTRLVGVVGAYMGITKTLQLADELTLTKSRLNLMNDGLQTSAELQNMIYASAQRSRSAYVGTAQAVAKLGILAKDAFSSNKEMVAFAEQMNKQFKIGGASIQEQSAAMYQLTQAMASGRLQGDEFRSIMENAPMLAQAIAEYTGKSMGDLRQMSADGEITADIIKNAMFAAADETNERFKKMPMTFAQVGTVIGNTLLKTFNPVIQTIGKGAQLIYDNWSTLEPIFYGLAAAVGLYAVMTGIQTAATWLSVAANRALITTMLSNPIMWIALVIGVLIGMIYKWVQSVGGLEIAWKICMNGILTAWDWVKIGFFTGIYWILDLWDKLKLGMMTAGVGIQNFMGDMKAGVLKILENMVNSAIGIINDFINILNKIPGVNIGLIEQVTFGTTAQMENEAAKRAREADLQDYRSQIEASMADRDAKLNQMVFDARSATATRQAEISAMQAVKAAEAMQGNDDVLGHLSNIAANTSSMSDSMRDFTDEELKYLRDAAETKVINRFTTNEIKIDMKNDMKVNSEMDLDGVVSYLEDKLYETMQISAEGVNL